ncbi:MAG TPA: zinc finger domain-containing protein [Steroidobacteraceae bacterium]|jgi:DnaJ-class molecular chaperone|nr:zinc finger domain-containing protein [Steroidobacteraceae bacterium]
MIKQKPTLKEQHCPACEGTGIAKVKQTAVPGRRQYPPRCEECGGKGRIASSDKLAEGGSDH